MQTCGIASPVLQHMTMSHVHILAYVHSSELATLVYATRLETDAVRLNV